MTMISYGAQRLKRMVSQHFLSSLSLFFYSLASLFIQCPPAATEATIIPLNCSSALESTVVELTVYHIKEMIWADKRVMIDSIITTVLSQSAKLFVLKTYTHHDA